MVKIPTNTDREKVKIPTNTDQYRPKNVKIPTNTDQYRQIPPVGISRRPPPGGAFAPTNGTGKQQDAIQEFSVWLHELWTKSFSQDNVLVRKTIRTRLAKHLKDYASSVQKRKGSKRMKVDYWKKSYNPMVLFDLKREDKNADEFPERERNYYYDQLSLARRDARDGSS